jgi:hypothetical protein
MISSSTADMLTSSPTATVAMLSDDSLTLLSEHIRHSIGRTNPVFPKKVPGTTASPCESAS